MVRIQFHLAALALGVASAAGSAYSAFAQCRYQITIIPFSPASGESMNAGGLNEHGQVAGSYFFGFGPDHAMAWDPLLGSVALPEPAGVFESSPADISDTPVHGPFGLVVGTMNVGPYRAFQYDGQAMIDLGTLGGIHSDAQAVNFSNWIVGSSGVGPANHATLWRNGQISDIGKSFGDSAFSGASDINDAGFVAGSIFGGFPYPGDRAFVWSSNGAVAFPPTPGGISSNAHAINNRSEILISGLYDIDSTQLQFRRDAFIYSDGEWTAIPAFGKQDDWPGLDFISNFPLDINDAGVIVGYCTSIEGFGVPYIWQNGILRRLDHMVVHPDPEKPYLGFAPWRINNAGLILGGASEFDSGNDRLVLLTPIPALPGDTNCDEVVNIDDLTDVILNWGVPGGAADLNFDQSVDILDLAQVIENWSVSK